LGGHRNVALRETDLAAIVHAKDAVRRLDVLALRLCYHKVTDDDICIIRECIADILAGLELARTIASRSDKEDQWNLPY